jgi:beta-glucosidase
LSIASVIGEASASVAGAAGESCKRFLEKGVGSIVMADGPAGVRISKRYYEDKKGKHSIGSTLPATMLDMFPGLIRKLIEREPKAKKGRVFKEQYCTAIPIATAIAQSWNTDFAELCGDIVGGEMDIFDIDLWLAPALNIHRNVLCGRNFEYFSEDPLISGKFAAALTRGVQKHPGRGVTIKHYAANNQETNRYANNSIISERALREIYLKGFGICIRESDPMAVMTSYNLLNGEHTSESRELAEVLFREFGFDGLIMTDWVVGGDMLLARGSKYGTPDAAKVAASGCSLFMPGSKGDYAQIIRGLKNGTVSVQQLRENAGRIMHVLKRLGKEE